jgi:hypothetical protein
MAIAGAITLTQAPPRVLRRGARVEEVLGSTTGRAAVCQAGETLPADTSAIRMGIEASFGPRVLVSAYRGSRRLTEGSRSANWTASSVTVPVRPLGREISNVKLCVNFPANSGLLRLWGASAASGKTAIGGTGQALSGRISTEFLGKGRGSWWSRALTVARHLGLGRSIGGTWIALLLATLMGGVCALISILAWRELP